MLHSLPIWGISQLGSTTTTDNDNLLNDNGSEITDDKFNDATGNCADDIACPLKICRMGTNVIKRQGGLIPIVSTNLMITIAAAACVAKSWDWGLLCVTSAGWQLPCCGVKRIGNVNVNGNTFGNSNVGDDLYRGVEETCVSHSAGEHWIWRGAPVRVSLLHQLHTMR